MIKYLKYYFSTFLLLLAIGIVFKGENYPTFFFISFSLFIILGDLFLKKDLSFQKYSYPRLINFPIYINFPLLIIYIIQVTIVFGNQENIWLINVFESIININLINVKSELSFIDKISVIALCALFIGIYATVPGHELTHRKKDKFDMFFGNWLLSISWDCAFAIEHVYGHHKNVGLKNDPATAKRGENIYKFIFRAIINEHLDAWKIELSHLKRRDLNFYSYNNKMITGYLRSLLLTLSAFFIGGLNGMFFYLVCAIIAKALLEVINFIEHYGLVREKDKPVCPRHSWNANNVFSSLLLYNVTRHSAHHEKASLQFWELKPYPNAPTMPYGYLAMLYIAIFIPFLFHMIMKQKLIDWDNNYATKMEKEIISIK